MQPLAERVRPQKLEQIVGQDELVGSDKILSNIVASGKPRSLIFWGPPGTGKTTLARIMAREFEADFIELSAVSSGKKDVEKVVAQARINQNTNRPTILFVDEIHRFNKAQQDAFLPHVESGLITLFGATTENPSFEVINPLLSRSQLIVLKPIARDDLIQLLKQAVKDLKLNKSISPAAYQIFAEAAAGDARKALGFLELALDTAPKIDKTTALKIVADNHISLYDKKDDSHYDIASAFIKSLRAGDVNAVSYYLARMLQAGEDPKFIARRMVIFASEDVGLAGNGALSMTISCFEAVTKIGLPEAKIPLFHVAIALAKSKKSRATYDKMLEAEAIAKKFPNSQIPLHIRNAPTEMMKNLGYAENYQWQTGFKHQKGHLPPEVEAAFEDQKIS